MTCAPLHATGSERRRPPDAGARRLARGAAPLLSCLLPAIASAWSPPAHALEAGWLVGGGIEYSDNINRAADGEEESDWLRDVRAGVIVSQETSRVDASADALVRIEDYAGNTFDDGPVFEGGGELDLALVPQRLTWVVRDSFQQVPQNNRRAVTAGNEQDANAFVTGPDLELPMGSVTFLRLGARYGDFYFAETDEDHIREVGQLGLARRISRTTEVSLNARTEDVTFDNEDIAFDGDGDPVAFQENFVADSAFVRYDRRLAGDGRITLDLGAFEVQRDELEDLDGPMAQLDVRRGLGPSAAFGFQLGHGATDVGTALSATRGDPLAANIDGVSVTGDVGEQSTARAFYTHQFGRLALNLGAGAEDNDYVADDELDRERAYATIGLDYRAGPRRTFFAEAGRTRVDYDIDEPTGTPGRYGDYDDYVYTLGVDQRLGRALTLAGAVSHDRRYAHGPGDDYEENRLLISLVYGFGHPDVVGEDAALADGGV